MSTTTIEQRGILGPREEEARIRMTAARRKTNSSEPYEHERKSLNLSLLATGADMYTHFELAWNDYKEILRKSWNNQNNAVYTAGEEFKEKFNSLKAANASAKSYVWPCIQALTYFVKVIDINPKFRLKEQWTNVLRLMVDYVRKVYEKNEEWTRYLETTPDWSTAERVNWPYVLAQVTAAEAEVKEESEKRQARNEGGVMKAVSKMVSRRRTEAELPLTHALARMRGLLGEI